MKAIKTILDPTKEVSYSSISSEHDGVQYFDKDGRRIAFVDTEVDYKPEYDFETSNIKHWWFKHRSELFRDCYTKIATFRSRNVLEKYLKAIVIIWFDKYIGRFFSHNGNK